MHLPPYLEVPLRLALLVGGLLLPGSMLLRALRLPWSLAAAFATSSALLYGLVVLFAWTGAVISPLTLAAGLGLVTIFARLVPVRSAPAPLSSSFSCFARMGGWLPLYVAFWLVVAYRLGFHPLNGPDNSFRWSWLAEQMLRVGSLDFYPPHQASDYGQFFWAESIPPGVASLYAWAYACGGGTHALWTSPVVALQLLSVHELVWRLASRWGGEAVARQAVLFAAACPLLTWSVTMGQETGLTALAVIGILWSLHHLRTEPNWSWAALAGIFSIVAAGTREYGVLFSALTSVALWWSPIPRLQAWAVAGVTLLVAAAWPARVWFLTGNPFYSLDVAGIFPTNPVFASWLEALRAPHRAALASLDSWSAVARHLVLWGLPGTIGLAVLIALLVRGLKEARWPAIFAGTVVLLWMASAGITAGGLFYSLRVLSPAFALLVVVAAYGAAHVPPAAGRAVAAITAVVLIESLPKTLTLPENPYRLEVREWPDAADRFPTVVRGVNDAIRAKLEPLPDRRRVLTDHAGLPRELASLGIEVVPLWSPEVAWLFDGSLPPQGIAARWQKSGLRHLVLDKGGATANYMQTHAQWRAPYLEMRPVAETDTHVILEVTVPMSSTK